MRIAFKADLTDNKARSPPFRMLDLLKDSLYKSPPLQASPVSSLDLRRSSFDVSSPGSNDPR